MYRGLISHILAAAAPETTGGKSTSTWQVVKDFFSKHSGSLWFQIVVGIIALLILIEILRIIKHAIGGKSKDKASWFGRRKIKRDAEKALRRKEFLKAGDLYLQIKNLDKAIVAYKKGALWLPAGEAYVRFGRLRDAARCFEHAELWERAAALYEDAGLFDRAVVCMERTQNQHGLVQLLERAREFSRAAEIHIELGNKEQAARCFDRAHEPGRAAEILHKVLENDYIGKARSKAKISELSQRVGELYLRAKRPGDAAHVFTLGEEFLRAAEVYADAGDYTAAGESYEAVGDLENAAMMYKNAGENARAAALMAEQMKDDGRLDEAARLFENAEQWNTAAELYFEIRIFDKAAESFMKAEEYARAGEAFALGGNYHNAAMAYEQDENWRLAADCYRKAGEEVRTAAALARGGLFYSAGKLYYEMDDADKAIENLQHVKSNDPKYLQATILLADCFVEKEMFSLARGKLENIIGDDTEATPENVDAFYLLARVEEEEGRYDRASELLDKVLEIDFRYRDAADRRNELKKKTSMFLSIPSADGEGKDSRSESGRVALVDPGGGVSFCPPRYENPREIGRGGMGLVYKLHDVVLGRDVAYKTLGAGLRDNQKALDNFMKEAKAAAALNHPNIVTIYDIGQFQGTHYITMECVEGKTIKEILRAGKMIPNAHIYQITRQMCEALDYAHSHKIVHRDIKTANIMVTTGLQVKILDFGLARVIDEMTMDGSKVVGTPSYMSPEQIIGKHIDYRTDIYSFGVSLFETMTCELPFKGGNVGYHHLNTEPPDPRMVNPEIPNDLAKIILKCLKKDMEERYQHARDILEDIIDG
ncbi:MAG: protein kinase domain-containing protein [Planctomycetota bacterium]|jgi:tetratricopeptide (TPR) repeat protein